MSPNLKRVKVFIKNGQVYQGGIEENLGHNLGGTRLPNTIQQGTGATEEKKD